MMQWSNWTKLWFLFQQSLPCMRSTHFFHRCCSTWIHVVYIEALILILEKVLNCRYDLIIDLILLPSQVLFFSCWGTENSQMVPNQAIMESDQPVQIHSHAQQLLQPHNCTCVQENCPGDTGLPASVFQAVLKCL